mgnify:FL=1
MSVYVLDIETTMDQKTIHCVVVRNISTGGVSTFFNSFEFRNWLGYHPISIIFIGHNIIDFDKRVLEDVWGVMFTKTHFIDTLVLSRLLFPERQSHSLKAWGDELGCPKIEFDKFDEYSPEMLQYCIQDTYVTQAVYTHLTKTAYDSRAVKLEHDVQHILTAMQAKGFKLDRQKVIDLKCDMEAELYTIEEGLKEVFPDEVIYVTMKTKVKTVITPFNPGSRQQVAKRLMEMGWKPTKLTPTGQAMVDEDTLKDVDIPEAKIIRRYFLLQKRVSQLDQWLEYVDDNDRVHCKIIGNGAVTGRATHSKPNLGQVVGVQSEYGKEFRECWTVDKGKLLVGVDLEGIEARIMAHYMQDDAYIQSVIAGDKKLGTDFHSVNMRAFGLTSRDTAKTAFYALIYGAGSAKMAAILGCSVREAKKRINDFYDNTPALKALKLKIERVAKQGWLPGLDGRRIPVRSAHSAMNTLFQSGGAVVSKQWMINTQEGIDKAKLYTTMDAKIVMWVHDELQNEVDEEHAQLMASICVKAAQETQHQLNLRVPVAAVAKIGLNWYETH